MIENTSLFFVVFFVHKFSSRTSKNLWYRPPIHWKSIDTSTRPIFPQFIANNPTFTAPQSNPRLLPPLILCLNVPAFKCIYMCLNVSAVFARRRAHLVPVCLLLLTIIYIKTIKDTCWWTILISTFIKNWLRNQLFKISYW